MLEHLSTVLRSKQWCEPSSSQSEEACNQSVTETHVNLLPQQLELLIRQVINLQVVDPVARAIQALGGFHRLLH